MDFKHRFEQAHVGTIVETDHILPNIDNDDLSDG